MDRRLSPDDLKDLDAQQVSPRLRQIILAVLGAEVAGAALVAGVFLHMQWQHAQAEALATAWQTNMTDVVCTTGLQARGGKPTRYTVAQIKAAQWLPDDIPEDIKASYCYPVTPAGERIWTVAGLKHG